MGKLKHAKISTTMIEFTTANSKSDLEEILQLQQKNLPKNISQEESNSQGFVTIEHDFNLLNAMNSPFPHIIAKSNHKVVAYALVMLRQWEKEIPILIEMFKKINAIEYDNRLLKRATYFIMGQICIAKEFRGQNVFSGLYQTMKKCMNPHFDYIITEVATRNTRSIRAHEKVGFETIKIYSAENGEEWAILLWKIGA